MQVGDIVVTRKNHPCGGNKWQVLRVGADYKLKCLTCGHTIMLDSNAVKKAVKSIDRQ